MLLTLLRPPLACRLIPSKIARSMNTVEQQVLLPKPQEPGPEDCCQVSGKRSIEEASLSGCHDVILVPDRLLCKQRHCHGETAKYTEYDAGKLICACSMQSGCLECVWEVYWQDLKAWQQQQVWHCQWPACLHC